VTPAAWSTEELDRIGTAEELEIAARRRDGSLRRAVPIWVVRVDDDLFVRSWRGARGSWYRTARETHDAHISAGGVERDVSLTEPGSGVDDAVDAAYRSKYGRYSTYVEPMMAPQARATTLKLMLLGEPGRGG
jgi:hypothetical protein